MRCSIWTRELFDKKFTIAEVQDFRECIQQVGLMDMRFQGSFLTWRNYQDGDSRIYAKLDRVSHDGEWLMRFENLEDICSLPGCLSGMVWRDNIRGHLSILQCGGNMRVLWRLWQMLRQVIQQLYAKHGDVVADQGIFDFGAKRSDACGKNLMQAVTDEEIKGPCFPLMNVLMLEALNPAFFSPSEFIWYGNFVLWCQKCIGKQRCAVTISNSIFGQDPCPNVLKQLSVEAVCAPV
ncbi:hypothetical protein Ancab_014521 [Ancistrocladus abbreviatus]